MVKKGALSIVLTLILSLWALPALAVSGNTPPEFNPVCWKEKECTDARQTLLRKNNVTLTDVEKKQIGEGWVEDPVACPGKGWGKCLPANVTVTAISINGQTRFLHIGTYIQTVYKFVLTIAGILAAAMMVIAGVQWVTSGGNAESISSAKTRIVNALVGMFLAYTSFFILNTIDPALINLRLPQVYLIKPQNAVPDVCAVAASSTTFVFAADAKDQKTAIDTSVTPDFDKNGISYADLTTSDKGFCGHRFFMKDGGATTCFGTYCSGAQGCANVDLATGDPGPYKCINTSFYGKVYDTNFITNPDDGIFARCTKAILFEPGYKFPYMQGGGIMEVCNTKELSLHYVLKDTGIKDHEMPNEKTKQTFFYFDSASGINSTQCGNSDESLGYVFWLGLKGACDSADDLVIGKNGAKLGKAETLNGEWTIDTNSALTKDQTFTLDEVKRAQSFFIDLNNLPTK